MSRGGSTDSEISEAIVTPVISSPRPAVTMLTPPATRRRAERKWSGSRAVSGTRWSSRLLIRRLLQARAVMAEPLVAAQRCASEEALGRKRRAIDQILPDRLFLVDDRVMRRQGAGVAPVPIEIGGLLGRRGAADVEDVSAIADGRVVRDDLGLRRQEGGPVGQRLGIGSPGIERLRGRVERFGGDKDARLRGMGGARDLADHLLLQRVFGRLLVRRIIDRALARANQRDRIAQSGAADAGDSRGQGRRG